MASKSNDGIPMKHPDGRDYTAEDEVEAMNLMARGYTREDGGQKSPPAQSTSKSSDTKATA
jgi:hypothetical protein